ncbi:MAG: YkgJ family cysteine cluster protein [bacterium]|nr:YkgJ family cysteine cluster protein [bacterium]
MLYVQCQELEKCFAEHILCKPGCHQCCLVEKSVLPIEAFIIEQQLQSLSEKRIRKLRANHRANDSICPMLWKNRCAVYLVRPISCRIAGLPILYREAEISFVDYCHLNFSRLPANHQFDQNSVLDLQQINSELTRLDLDFSDNILQKKWRPNQRILLKDILYKRKPDRLRKRNRNKDGRNLSQV